MEGVLPERNHAVRFVAVYDDGTDSHAVIAIIAVVIRRLNSNLCVTLAAGESSGRRWIGRSASPGRTAGGERSPCTPALDENEATASRAAGTTSESSACRADPEVHTGAMRVPGLRQRDGRDRLMDFHGLNRNSASPSHWSCTPIRSDMTRV
jgi:hypothetical protein